MALICLDTQRLLNEDQSKFELNELKTKAPRSTKKSDAMEKSKIFDSPLKIVSLTSNPLNLTQNFEREGYLPTLKHALNLNGDEYLKSLSQNKYTSKRRSEYKELKIREAEDALKEEKAYLSSEKKPFFYYGFKVSQTKMSQLAERLPISIEQRGSIKESKANNASSTNLRASMRTGDTLFENPRSGTTNAIGQTLASEIERIIAPISVANINEYIYFAKHFSQLKPEEKFIPSHPKRKMKRVSPFPGQARVPQSLETETSKIPSQYFKLNGQKIEQSLQDILKRQQKTPSVLSQPVTKRVDPGLDLERKSSRLPHSLEHIQETTPSTIIHQTQSDIVQSSPMAKSPNHALHHRAEKAEVKPKVPLDMAPVPKMRGKQGKIDKDNVFSAKLLAYREFHFNLNFSNGCWVSFIPQTITSYRFKVGRGNNSPLVKSVLKKRWWWIEVEADQTDINLLWTQTKDNAYIDRLKCSKRKFESLENATTGNLTIESSTLSENSISEDNCLSEHLTDSDCEGKVVHRIKSSANKSDKKEKELSGKTIKRQNHRIGPNETAIEPGLLKLFTKSDFQKILKVQSSFSPNVAEEEFDETVKNISKAFGLTNLGQPSQLRVCNKLENNYHLSNKKGLYYNLRYYYEVMKENVFDHLPQTFHIQDGVDDKEFQKFLESYKKKTAEIQEQEQLLAQFEKEGAEKQQKSKIKRKRNIWIIKPGEHTNRGNGISVASELQQTKDIVGTKEFHPNGKKKTYIVQEYLDRPFLYNRRKFDIRCYMMITAINGKMKGYWYQDGYIRTSSKEFNVKNLANRMIHLTNDAVQKKGEEYGKFENGNKISYSEFQRYLDLNYPDAKLNFMKVAYPQMKKLAQDSIRSVYGKIDQNKREHTFEIFGLDFMIDENFKVWLIEINTNPCLELSSPLLGRIIPAMLEDAFRIAIDPIFPPPLWSQSKKHLLPDNVFDNNKFELIFDEEESGPYLRNLLNLNNQPNMEEIYEIEEENESDQSFQDPE
eukprot:TRINITY_DN13114_c0_g2_i1.p1 TRINITY_DN13114_c0_g2~~TRINITY_DN13114_c0_g2_i1.p1  ORF type:complete len:1000 (+),score=219.17 TRINITY_DN13114_c0_g2_i1:100-3099(+)